MHLALVRRRDDAGVADGEAEVPARLGRGLRQRLAKGVERVPVQGEFNLGPIPYLNNMAFLPYYSFDGMAFLPYFRPP